MAEVMVSLIVFIVAVVGLVAMESRGIEAQRASMETREGERLAQEVMAELMATSFDELVDLRLRGRPKPHLPYDDVNLDTWDLRDYGSVPNATGERAPGTRDRLLLGRAHNQPLARQRASAPPTPIQLEVTVLVDRLHQPGLPAARRHRRRGSRARNLDPANPNYLPCVRGVQLRTVRVNDARNPT